MKRELQGRVQAISNDYEEEQKQTFEITQDMTRQYKGMQEELLSRVRNRLIPFSALNSDVTNPYIGATTFRLTNWRKRFKI